MRPGLIEVKHIRVEHSLKLLLLEDEQVIETFATHTPQKALTDGIGSWSVIRCFENLDATRVCNPSEARSKLAIIIPDEVFRSLSVGCGFAQLLRDPGIARRACDAHMDHFARVQFDDEESKKRTEKQVGDWEKVTGPDLLCMSAQEGCPGLPMWSSRAHVSHVFLDCAFTDVNIELEQFATDPLGSPQSVVPGHVLDQDHDLCSYLWFASSCQVFARNSQDVTFPGGQKWSKEELLRQTEEVRTLSVSLKEVSSCTSITR